MLLQQQVQFQEAMRIQAAMKQMPLDDGEMNGAGMGLRVKKGAMGAQAAEEFELAAPVIDGSENRPFEE